MSHFVCAQRWDVMLNYNKTQSTSCTDYKLLPHIFSLFHYYESVVNLTYTEYIIQNTYIT